MLIDLFNAPVNLRSPDGMAALLVFLFASYGAGCITRAVVRVLIAQVGRKGSRI